MSPSLDILGESVPVPDPDAISGLASHYTSVSATMKDVHDQLTALQQDAHWTGTAAQNFRANLSDLPGELTKAYNSYSDMGSTLSTYSQGVSDWLGRLTHAVNQANDVQYELEQAKNALEQAQASGGDTTGMQTNIDTLKSELQWYQGVIYRLFNDDLSALASTCVQGIQNAENAGISNTFWGGISQDLGDIGTVLGDVGGFVSNVVLKPLEDLPGDLAFLATHLDDPEAWSHVLRDLTGVLTDVLMVAALASLVVPGLGEVDLGLLGVAVTAMSVVKTGTDAAAALEGEAGASWGDVGWDVADDALAGMGNYADGAGDLVDDVSALGTGGLALNGMSSDLSGAADILNSVGLPSGGLLDSAATLSEQSTAAFQALDDTWGNAPSWLTGGGFPAAGVRVTALKITVDVGHEAVEVHDAYQP
jgi:uncharacterized protein YukE